MFKNCVFKADVNTVKWLKAAGVRAIKTVAQTAIATIGASATMGEVNWVMVGSASLLAGMEANAPLPLWFSVHRLCAVVANAANTSGSFLSERSNTSSADLQGRGIVAAVPGRFPTL